MKRRTFLKRTTGIFVGVAGLIGGTFFYSREIEPSSLQIRKETIQSNKFAQGLDNKKIVQFSDTHLGFDYSIEDLKELIVKINDLSPDIIVFTGDLIDNPNHSDDTFEMNISETLAKLNAPDGKYWIYGNHDHGGYGTDRVLKIMNNAGFNLLLNSHEEVYPNFILAGIDDVMLGEPDLATALSNATPDSFTMLLAHEPDFADETVKFPVDVQLSGHSHGGQIRFPILGHLYTPIHAEKYVLGKYQIQNQLDLFVNAGIGTTRVPYRLFCKPEIHEYTLKSHLS